MRELNFAISPCPNDTFIFGGLLLGKIDFPFETRYILRDVEELNNLCMETRFHVIKVSAAIYSRVRDKYSLLRCGGAIGRGCGPVVVSRNNMAFDEFKDITIAIPGKKYHCFFLFLKRRF